MLFDPEVRFFTLSIHFPFRRDRPVALCRAALHLRSKKIVLIPQCADPYGNRLRRHPGMDGDYGVGPVQPGPSDSPPDCRIGSVRFP